MLPALLSPPSAVIFDDGSGPREAVPTREYLAGSDNLSYRSVPRALPKTFDDALEMYGVGLYDVMDCGPDCRAAAETFKVGIVGKGPSIHPNIEADPSVPDEQQAPEVKDSIKAAEVCRAIAARMETTPIKISYAMTRATTHGAVLAEMVHDQLTSDHPGVLAGLLVLRDIRVKPPNVWYFVVDSYGQTIGIAARTPTPKGASDFGATPTELILYPKEHFFIFSWLPRDGDPRGTSNYRAAYDPWVENQQLRLRRYNFLARFGEPRIAFFMPPTVEEVFQVKDPATGQEDKTAPRRAATAAAGAAVKTMMGGGWGVFPNGSAMQVIESQQQAGAYTEAMTYNMTMIFLAIINNSRTLQEARFGSKADSETGERVTEGLHALGRLMLSSEWEDQIWWRQLEQNFGAEFADAYCPEVRHGPSRAEDFSTVAMAVAALERSGFISDDQRAWIDREILNWTVRKRGPTPKEPAADGNGQRSETADGNDEPPADGADAA